MKRFLWVLVSISLILTGCSSTSNKKEDGKISQTSDKKETETEKKNEQGKETNDSNGKEAESDKASDASGDTAKGSTETNKKNDQSKPNTNNAKPANKQPSVSSNPIVQAALKYRGSSMACDELATMALVDAGVISGNPIPIVQGGKYYNIGVYQFPALATPISASSAQPGDLIYYDDGGLGFAHIAVYAGNGQAVHGGWNGRNVVLNAVDIGGSTPKYLRFPAQSWQTIENTLFPSSKPVEPNVNDGNNSNPPSNNTVPEIPSNPDIPSDVGGNSSITTYTSTYDVNGVSISVTASTPIDDNFMFTQLQAYVFGEITYEQLVASVQAKGYTVN